MDRGRLTRGEIVNFRNGLELLRMMRIFSYVTFAKNIYKMSRCNQNVTLMSYYIIKAVFNGEVGEAGF